MGNPIKTLIVTDDEVKKAFKVECAKNGSDMSSVTEMLWIKYITLSIDKRRSRREQLQKQKNGQQEQLPG